MDNDLSDDYRHEQNAHDAVSALPRATDGKIARYWKGQDCPDSTTCDIVYIDRLTGKEIMRYDGADPANTRFDYGATPDADIFTRKGLNIKEMIDKDKSVVTNAELFHRMRSSFDDYYYEEDY